MMLGKLAGVMGAVAVLTLAPVAWDYIGVTRSGQACPDAQGVAGFCIESDEEQTYVTFDSESFEAQDTSTLLAGILTASAAILAIWFTLNQIVLSNIYQRYGSKLVESYAGVPTGVFMVFVLMVPGSAALLFAYNSLPGWIAASAVFVLTAGLFATLWFFAQGFMRMMLVMSPYRLVKDAKNKILADMKASKDAPARLLTEAKYRRLIRVLGDTAVKSVASNDDDVCMYCVDALGNVGRTGLSKMGIGGNMKAVAAAEVLERIFKSSTRTENSIITRRILIELNGMAGLAMRYKSNEHVVGFLYGSGGADIRCTGVR